MLHFMNGTWIRRSFSTGSIHSAPSGELVYQKYDDQFQNAMINRGVIKISYGVFDAQGLRMSMEDEHVFIPDLDQHLLEIVESATTTTEKTNRKNSYGLTHNSNSSSNNQNSGEMVEESGSVNGGRRQSLRLTTNALAQLLRRESFVSSQSPPTTPTSSPQSNAHHPHHHHTNNHNTNYNNNINDISNNDIKTTNSSPSSPLTIPSHYSNSPASSAPSSPLSSSAYSSSPPTVVLPPLLQRKSMPTFSSSIFPEEMGCNLYASNPHCAFAVFGTYQNNFFYCIQIEFFVDSPFIFLLLLLYSKFMNIADGHSGDDAAIYCKEHLCNHIITNGHYAKNIPKAMQEAYVVVFFQSYLYWCCLFTHSCSINLVF